MGEKNEKKMWQYVGAVYVWDRIASDRWTARTQAVSQGKARSNFAFQFKKQNGLISQTKIVLPGKIQEVTQ